MWFLAQTAQKPQLPPLPDGPLLERARAPIEPTGIESWPLIIALIALLLIVAWFAWLGFRKCRRHANTYSPYVAATGALDAAATLTKGDDERYAILSAQALRRYLCEQVGIGANSSTSDEFLQAIARNQTLPSSEKEALARIFARFDHVKFARGRINSEERQELTDTLCELIGQIERRRTEESKKGGGA